MSGSESLGLLRGRGVANTSTPAVPPARQSRHLTAIAAFGVLAMLAMTFGADGLATQFRFNLWLLYAIAATGFYIVFGISGQFAFSHAAMFGFGAYVSAWAARSVPVAASIVLGVVAASLLALVLILLVGRSRQFYFAVATLSFSEAVFVVITRWPEFSGPGGEVQQVARLELVGHRFGSQEEIFPLFLAVLLVSLVMVVLLERSPVAREARAIRDNEIVSASMGLAVRRSRIRCFVLGSAYAALAGALFAHWQGVIGPGSFDLQLGIGFFLMVILGGIGSMWGGVVGAFVYVFLPEQLRFLSSSQGIVYGLLLTITIMVSPDGLTGAARRLASGTRRLVGSRRAPEPRPTEAGGG